VPRKLNKEKEEEERKLKLGKGGKKKKTVTFMVRKVGGREFSPQRKKRGKPQIFGFEGAPAGGPVARYASKLESEVNLGPEVKILPTSGGAREGRGCERPGASWV